MFLKVVKPLLIVFTFLLLSGCQKELSDFYKGSNLMTLNEFFKGTTNSSLQPFSLNTSTNGSIKGKNGTRFSFQPLSFVDLNGNLIRGTVKLEILEILTPSDIILNNTPTMSNGLPLESGGAFYIRATYNNSKANIAPGSFVKIDLTSPSASLPGMRVFAGNNQDTTRSVNWLTNNNPGNMIITDSVRGNVNGIDTMPELFSDSLEWINCDRYMNEPKIQNSFQFENNPDKDSTAVFVQYTGRNSVIRIFKDANANFISTNLIAAPVTVVGICIKNRILYSSITAISLRDKLSINLRFAEDTQEALKAKLQSLK